MVVSLANVSPGHASHYYTTGNAANHLESSRWSGKLTQPLGLSGTVQPASLEHLLYGRAATGEMLLEKYRLHQQQANARSTKTTPPTERAGVDLTASAPKSVSVQALVFGDDRLETAQQQANAAMLQVLEERYAMLCLRDGGERRKVITGELAIASFHHDTSRALDPQLHTHNVVLNLQRRPDNGRWQSLDNAAIYKAKMLLGQLYRNELALQVQALGYRLRITDPQHGLWELEGFSRQHLKAFSTRRQQLEAVAGANASPQAQLRAVQLTRPNKQALPRSELRERWQAQATTTQMLPLTPLEPFTPPNPDAVAQALVAQSLVVLTTQNIAVQRDAIERVALRQPGWVSFAALQQAIKDRPTLSTGETNHAFSRTQRQNQRREAALLTTTDTNPTATGRFESRTTTQSTSDADGTAAHAHVSKSDRATTGSSTTRDDDPTDRSTAAIPGAIAGAATHRTDPNLGGHGAASPGDSETRRSADRTTGEADVADSPTIADQPHHAQAIGGGDDQTLRYPDAFTQLAAEFRHLAAVFATPAPAASGALAHGEVGSAERATPTDQSDGTGNESPTEDLAPEHSQRPGFNVQSQRAESSLVDDPDWEDELELRQTS